MLMVSITHISNSLEQTERESELLKHISNQEILYFDHTNASSKYLLIVNRSIYFVCNGITKSAISKKDGNRHMLLNMLHN